MYNDILKAAELRLEENPKNYDAFKIYALARLLKNSESVNGSHDWENKDIAQIATTEAHNGSCTMHDCYNAYSDKKAEYRQGACSDGELTDLLHESLKTSRKIIAEMYANCDIVEEQNAIKAFVESLNKLVR